jgi:hypothetical protein
MGQAHTLWTIILDGDPMKIEYVPRVMAERFADAYAGQKKGFSAREISEYFLKYSNLVKHVDFYGVNPTRHDLFLDSLYSLEPKQQYYALNDLTFFEYPSKYPYPSTQTREILNSDLHTFVSPNPIGLRISRLRETAYRTDWIEAVRNITTDPPGAITASRTMLETALKTILSERKTEDTSAGDLGRLVKQVEKELGLIPGNNPAEHQIITGTASIVNGLSALSNDAGDRHGTVGGKSIDDPALAELCVNLCGAIGILFIELHLMTPVQTNSV